MKTLLTFTAICFFTLSSMAADRFPTVTIKSIRNFEIVVDGKTFHNNFIRFDRLNRGVHTIKIYERRRGLFGSRKYIVSSKKFRVKNDDIQIDINRNGRVHVMEISGKRNNNRNWKNMDSHSRRDTGYENGRNNKRRDD